MDASYKFSIFFPCQKKKKFKPNDPFLIQSLKLSSLTYHRRAKVKIKNTRTKKNYLNKKHLILLKLIPKTIQVSLSSILPHNIFLIAG